MGDEQVPTWFFSMLPNIEVPLIIDGVTLGVFKGKHVNIYFDFDAQRKS